MKPELSLHSPRENDTPKPLNILVLCRCDLLAIENWQSLGNAASKRCFFQKHWFKCLHPCAHFLVYGSSAYIWCGMYWNVRIHSGCLVETWLNCLSRTGSYSQNVPKTHTIPLCTQHRIIIYSTLGSNMDEHVMWAQNSKGLYNF